MSWAAAAPYVLGGATIIGGYLSGQQQAEAQEAANEANAQLSREQIAEKARQFDIGQLESERRYGLEFGREAQRYAQQYGAGGLSQSMRDYAGQQLGGYNTAGQAATQQQQALLGLAGPEAAAQAMKGFVGTPGQEWLRSQQEKAVLRNAAATGGLRGGRVQTALQDRAFQQAQTDYGNYFNRLAGLSGQGLSAGQAMTARDIGVLNNVGQQGLPGQQALPGQVGAPGTYTGQPAMNFGPQVGGGGGPSMVGYPQGGGTLTQMNAQKAAQEEAKRQADLQAASGFDYRFAEAMKQREKEQRRQQSLKDLERLSTIGP